MSPATPIQQLVADNPPNPTSPETAKANVLAASIENVRVRNLNDQAHYDGAVRDYNANLATGQKHDASYLPPIAPLKWQLADVDAEGYTFYQQGPEHLVPTPPLTISTVDLGNLTVAPRDPNHIAVGNRIEGAWFQVGSGDGTPNGFQTPPNTVSADGVTGTFTKFGAPVGAGWYLKS